MWFLGICSLELTSGHTTRKLGSYNNGSYLKSRIKITVSPGSYNSMQQWHNLTCIATVSLSLKLYNLMMGHKCIYYCCCYTAARVFNKLTFTYLLTLLFSSFLLFLKKTKKKIMMLLLMMMMKNNSNSNNNNNNNNNNKNKQNSHLYVAHYTIKSYGSRACSRQMHAF